MPKLSSLDEGGWPEQNAGETGLEKFPTPEIPLPQPHEYLPYCNWDVPELNQA